MEPEGESEMPRGYPKDGIRRNKDGTTVHIPLPTAGKKTAPVKTATKTAAPAPKAVAKKAAKKSHKKVSVPGTAALANMVDFPHAKFETRENIRQTLEAAAQLAQIYSLTKDAGILGDVQSLSKIAAESVRSLQEVKTVILPVVAPGIAVGNPAAIKKIQVPSPVETPVPFNPPGTNGIAHKA